MVFGLGPDVSISLGARTKVPGDRLVGEDVELIAHREPGVNVSPYERLLIDAMNGDAELFSRQDIVEASWRIVDPVLDDATPLHLYPQGSWGPEEAEHLIAGDGGWHAPGRRDRKAIPAPPIPGLTPVR